MIRQSKTFKNFKKKWKKWSKEKQKKDQDKPLLWTESAIKNSKIWKIILGINLMLSTKKLLTSKWTQTNTKKTLENFKNLLKTDKAMKIITIMSTSLRYKRSLRRSIIDKEMISNISKIKSTSWSKRLKH